MKKLLTLFLLGITVAASAATVYDVYETSYTNAYNEGTAGAYYTIRMKEAGSLWITDFFNNTGSDTQSELLTSPTYGITRYGYKDSTGTYSWSIIDESRISQGDSYKYNLYKGENADVMYRNKYYLGDFSKGAELEVFLADSTNTVASNTPAGYHLSTFNKRTDALAPTMDVGQLFLPGSAQINFGIVAAGTGTTDSPPMGSPLPPVWPSLLFAGGIAVLAYHKKERLT